MKKYLSILSLFFASALYAQDWKEGYADALDMAKTMDCPIILVFSGSDWCAPCIKLDRNIWTSDVFRDYSKANFALYRADFPRKKANRLPDKLAAENAALAERYNPNGHFPLVLLLDREGSVLGSTGYRKGTPENYIEHLKFLVK